MSNTKKTVFSGLLAALEIVLTRFTQIPIVLFGNFNDRINLGFLPIALSGALFGPVIGGITAGVADLIRAIIFPQGAFNPLFTLLAALRGVVYGIILHKKPTPLRMIIASAINFILVNVLLMSLIMKISYYPDTSIYAVMLTKLPVSAVNFVIQAAVLALAAKPIERNLKNV